MTVLLLILAAAAQQIPAPYRSATERDADERASMSELGREPPDAPDELTTVDRDDENIRISLGRRYDARVNNRLDTRITPEKLAELQDSKKRDRDKTGTVAETESDSARPD